MRKSLRIRNGLWATAALTAAIGCSTLAIAQNENMPGHAGSRTGVQSQSKGPSGGSVAHTPLGAGAQTQQGGQGAAPSRVGQGQSQSEPNRRVGQGESKSLTPQRGAQQQGGTGNMSPQRGAQEQGGTGNMRPQRGAQQQGGTGNEKPQRNAQQGGAGGAPSVQLSQDQRTRIGQIILKDKSAPRAGNVNFSVTVGAIVPRDVHVTVLPEDIVTIVPQYRGFDYVLVRDEILIVDPRTLEIVAIITA